MTDHADLFLLLSVVTLVLLCSAIHTSQDSDPYNSMEERLGPKGPRNRNGVMLLRRCLFNTCMYKCDNSERD